MHICTQLALKLKVASSTTARPAPRCARDRTDSTTYATLRTYRFINASYCLAPSAAAVDRSEHPASTASDRVHVTSSEIKTPTTSFDTAALLDVDSEVLIWAIGALFLMQRLWLGPGWAGQQLPWPAG